MAGLKTETDNTQFGLASPDGTRAGAGKPTATAGWGIEPLVDLEGRIYVAPGGSPAPPGFPTKVQLSAVALIESAVLRVGPGSLEQINGWVDSADEAPLVFVQLYDLDAAPGVGDVPFERIPVSGGRLTYGYAPPSQWAFVTGLVIAFSTVPFSFTGAGAIGDYNATIWTP